MKNLKKDLGKILFLFLFSYFYSACKINTSTNGFCIEKNNTLNEITFCKENLPINFCIPYNQVKI